MRLIEFDILIIGRSQPFFITQISNTLSGCKMEAIKELGYDEPYLASLSRQLSCVFLKI